jgi:hypothetical protein
MCVCYVCVCLRVYNTHTHTQVNKNEVTLESPAFASAMLRNGHESGADRDFGSKLLFPVQMLLEALNVSPPTHTQTQEFSLQEAMEWQGGEGGGGGGAARGPPDTPGDREIPILLCGRSRVRGENREFG